MKIPLNELKKALIAEGFQVYRTLNGRIVLAERVRDNLIMDSGVSAVAGEVLSARFAVRAQASDFPGETERNLFNRARQLALKSLGDGYAEVQTNVVPVHDPGDRERVLDTWYEVAFEKAVASLEELFSELRHAQKLEKIVQAGRS